MSHTGRRFLSLCRTLHVYLTMLGVVVMLFFSVTGVMLNHKEWFGLKEKERMPRGAEVDRASARPEVPPESRGALMRLLNLHKGAGGSIALKLAIDVAAFLLLVGSVTGIILLFSLPRSRRFGLLAMGIGAVLCLTVYCLAAP